MGGEGRVETLVGVELGEDGGVFGKVEECSGDELGVWNVEVDAGVFAEVVQAAGDGGGAEPTEGADGGGDGGGSAVGVEGAVDEEGVGHCRCLRLS